MNKVRGCGFLLLTRDSRCRIHILSSSVSTCWAVHDGWAATMAFRCVPWSTNSLKHVGSGSGGGLRSLLTGRFCSCGSVITRWGVVSRRIPDDAETIRCFTSGGGVATASTGSWQKTDALRSCTEWLGDLGNTLVFRTCTDTDRRSREVVAEGSTGGDAPRMVGQKISVAGTALALTGGVEFIFFFVLCWNNNNNVSAAAFFSAVSFAFFSAAAFSAAAFLSAAVLFFSAAAIGVGIATVLP